MTEAALHRKYADMIGMCIGTTVKPHQCVKYFGETASKTPMLTGIFPEEYSFAFAILKDKPVFPGDTLFVYDIPVVAKYKAFGWIVYDTASANDQSSPIENFSWNKKLDPFQHLIDEQNQGKRIAWMNFSDKWCEQEEIEEKVFKSYPLERWKIIEPDEVEIVHFYKWGDTKIQLTKCGLSGEITAKVI